MRFSAVFSVPASVCHGNLVRGKCCRLLAGRAVRFMALKVLLVGFYCVVHKFNGRICILFGFNRFYYCDKIRVNN